MTLLEVKSEYVRQYKELLEGKGFEQIQGCNGEMNETELEANAIIDYPILYIGITGTGSFKRSNEVIQGEVNIVMYIFCKSSASDTAGNLALGLVHKVIVESRHLAHMEFVGLPQCVDSSNMYSKNMKDMNVSMWSVRFKHEVLLEEKVIETIGRIKHQESFRSS